MTREQRELCDPKSTVAPEGAPLALRWVGCGWGHDPHDATTHERGELLARIRPTHGRSVPHPYYLLVMDWRGSGCWMVTRGKKEHMSLPWSLHPLQALVAHRIDRR